MLQQLLRLARTVFGPWRHRLQSAVAALFGENPQSPGTLDFALLEDRILMSAAPLGAEAVVAEAAIGSPDMPAAGMQAGDHPVDGGESLMASADASALLAQLFDAQAVSSPEHPAADDPASSSSPGPDSAERGGQDTRHELVFVDPHVRDYQQLVNDLVANSGEDRSLDVAVLDAGQDGIDQVTHALASHHDLDAVHFVAHATGGAVRLGSTWLGSQTLAARAEDVAQWRESLNADADLVFYGCDLAAGPEATSLLDTLGSLTGADVAASTDGTGQASQGGDWDLEYHRGVIETHVAFSDTLQHDWTGLMDSTSTGTALWGQSGLATPQYSTWDGVAFGAEANSAAVGTWRIVQGAAAPSRDELVVLGVNAAGAISGQIGDGTTWNALPFALDTVSESNGWGFDVAYETQSGDAMVVWNNGTTGTEGLSYRVWDGSAWSSELTVTTPLAGEAQHMQLVADPTSDEMILVVSNSSSFDYALVWNGSSWGNSQVLATDSADNRTDVSVAYEAQSGEALVAYTDNNSDARYRTWNGTAWSGESTLVKPAGPGGVVRWTTMASDPTSDRIALGALTAANETWLAVWDGAAWGSQQVATTAAAASTSPNVAVAFETVTGELLAAYGQSSNSVFYRTWTPLGGWSAELAGPDLGAVPNSLILSSDPLTNHVMLSVQDSTSDVRYVLWDGAAWGLPNELETNTGETANQPFLFLWDEAPSNHSPAIALPGGAITYTENDPATVIDSLATATDADLTDFDTGTLTVDLSAGGTDDDRLAIRNQGTGAGQIGVSGSNVTYAGTTIGSFAGGTDGSTPLVVTFNANADADAVQALMRNITFANVSENPVTAARTVRMVLTDGDGGVSNSETETINLAAVNDAPVNDMPDLQVTDVSTALVFSLFSANGISVTDADAGGNTVQVTLAATQGTLTLSTVAGLAFSSGDGAADASMQFTGTLAAVNAALEGMSYSPTPGYSGAATITMTTSDQGNSGAGGALTDVDTLSIQVGAIRFQQGLGGYADADDTEVRSNAPGTSYGNSTYLRVDLQNSEDGISQGLIRFDSIFGSAPGQIPYNSTINSASLTVYASEASSGSTVALHRMLVNWSEASTWNSLAGGIQTNGAEAAAAADSSLALSGGTGFMTLSGLAGALQDWSDGAANYGWAMLIDSTDGWQFHSSEYGTVIRRPYLTVDFTPPQPPVLDLDADNSSGQPGANFAAAFIENGGPVLIADSDAALADADSAHLTSLTVQIANLLDGAAESLAATTAGTSISASYNSATGVLTLSGSDTVAHYQQVLRTVTYNNSSQDPNTTARTIQFTAHDGINSSNVGTTTLTMAAQNDAPVNTVPGAQSMQEDGTLVFSTANGNAISIADVDAGTASLQFTISASNGTLTLSGTTGLAFNSGDGTSDASMQFTGTLTDINAALNGMTFTPTANFHGGANIAIVASDLGHTGAGGALTDTDNVSIQVNPVNDPPVISLPAGPLSYTENDPATVIDPTATVTDIDLVDFNTGALTVDFSAGGTADDRLAIRHQGTGAGQIGVSGSNVTYAGTTIGTFVGGTNGSIPLVVTFNASADAAAVQALMRNVTFANVSDNLSTAPRNVRMVLTDGDGGTSNLQTEIINLSAANDAPVLDLDAGQPGVNFSTTFTEDGPAVFVADADATLSDVDSATLQSLSVTITNLLDGPAESLTASTGGTAIIAAYNPATGVLTLSGADSVANYQQVLRSVQYQNTSQNPSAAARQITFVANDGAANSNVGTTTVAMVAQNDAPVLDLDAGQPGANFSTTFTEDGPAVLVADADASLSDVDNATLQSLSVTITNLLDGPAESLTASTGGTAITAAYNPATGALNFSGADSVANYQQVLRTVQYQNTSQNPSTAARQITFVANDGLANSNVGTTTVAMIAQNDAPVLDLDAGQPGTNYSTTFTEDGPAVLVADADAILSDVDSATLQSLSVTITNLADGPAESLTASTGGTAITAAYNPATGALTFSGADSVANYQQVLRTIQYQNTAQTPTTVTRQITFVASDGLANSIVATTSVAMIGQNDAPVLDLDANQPGADFTATFTEDGPAVFVANADATLSDIDSTTLQSLSVTITNLLDGAAESLAANTGGTAITHAYNPAAGILTLSGADSMANYQQVLRTVQYQNTAQNPRTAARQITFVANDGAANSNVGTTMVTMIAQNDAPTLDLDADDSSGRSGADFDAAFSEDGGPVLVADSDAVLQDVDDFSLPGMVVRIENLLDGLDEALSADTTGTAIAATYDPATGTLTLFGPDSLVNYQQVLRSIRYENASQDPNTTERQITVVANDGLAPTNLGTATVAVVAQNDAPVHTLPAAQATAEDNRLLFSAAGGNAILIQDVDVAAGTVEVTLRVTGGAITLGDSTGLVFSAGDGAADSTMTFAGTLADVNAALDTLAFDPAADYHGQASLEIHTNDQGHYGLGAPATADDVIAITILPINDAPVAGGDAYELTQSNTLSVTVPGVLANDGDVDGDGLRAVLVAGPAHGTLTLGMDGAFTYTPNPAFHGVDEFSYLPHDGSADGNSATVTLVVAPLPAPPPPPTTSPDTSSPDSNSDEDQDVLAPTPADYLNEPEQRTERIRRAASAIPGQGSSRDEYAPLPALTGADQWDEDSASHARDPRWLGAKALRARSSVILPGAALSATSLLHGGVIWEQLDELARQLDEGLGSAALTVGAVAGITGALSVGYVMWALRGGYLLTTLLASTPLWSLVDPLPILEFAESEDRKRR